MHAIPEKSAETGEQRMITLTKLDRLSKETFVLNCDLIEIIEERPDTTIRLVNGKHFVVAESAFEVVEKIVAYKRSININTFFMDNDSSQEV